MLKTLSRLSSCLIICLWTTALFAFRAPEPGREQSKDIPSNTGQVRAGASGSFAATRAQTETLRSYPGVRARWDAGTPRSMRGFSRTTAAAPAQAAIEFLEEIKPVYRMKSATQELRLRREHRDSLGYTHVRLNQYYRDLPVINAELIVHINNRNQVYQVNGNYRPDLDLDTTTRLTSAQAVETCRSGFRTGAGVKTFRAPRLVIYHCGTQPRTAYEVVIGYSDLSRETGRWRYYVDAQTGTVLNRINEIRSYVDPPTEDGVPCTITGSRINGEDGATVSFQGCRDDTTYYLYGQLLHWLIINLGDPGVYVDGSDYAWRTSADWSTSDRVEISAANNFAAVQSYVLNVLGRDSFDNASAQADGYVHYGTDYANAYWDGYEFVFGDGDGVSAGPLVTLDVVAHEYGHAWTQYTSDLIYQDESGAINESCSDIMGALAEFASQPDGRAHYPSSQPGQADWLMGEDCWLESVALRDMRSPANAVTVGVSNRQPSLYHGTHWYTGLLDEGGVHTNSGPMNFCFYLLAEGGAGTNDGLPYSVTGLGIENAGLIAYRANTYYLTPSSSFQDARQAWIDSALDINPAWENNVKAAWDAIGVADAPDSAQESFEAGSFRGGWTTSGSARWTITSDDKVHGSLAARSGDINDNQFTSLRWTGTVEAGPVSFFVRTSSENHYDYLEFRVDQQVRTKWCGETDWNSYFGRLTAGTHTLEWRYTKDGSVSTGNDAVWLDAINLPRLRIQGQVSGGLGTASPASQYIDYNGQATLEFTPQAGYHLAALTDNGLPVTPAATYTVSGATTSHTVAATFAPDTFPLTIEIDGSGSVTRNPGLETYYYGTVVQLTAAPGVGWHFTGWSGDAAGSETATAVAMTGARSVTAHFAPNAYTLTVNTAGSGTASPSPDQATYAHGDIVQISAVPAAGWHFAGWSGDASGAETAVNVTMTANRTVTASFALNTYLLTANVTGNGAVARTPDQSVYDHGTTVQLTAVPGTGWHFTGWSGDAAGSETTATLTMNGPRTVTAQFEINTYALDVNVTGDGSVTRSPDQTGYSHGSVVRLVAAPSPGHHLVAWSGDAAGAETGILMTMTAPRTVTAAFAINRYKLAVGFTGSGSVTRSPEQADYPHDTSVELTAIPTVGYHLVNWTGDAAGSDTAIAVTMTKDKAVVGVFAINAYSLTILTDGNGVVFCDPDQSSYTHWTPIRLTAEAGPGWHFAGWSGDASGADSSALLWMTADTLVAAAFAPNTDANADGAVDLQDLLRVLREAMSASQPPPADLDVNGDGKVDILDVMLIYRLLR